MDREKILEIYTDASGENGFGILFINPDETERQYSYKIYSKDLYNFFDDIDKNDKQKNLSSTTLELFAIYVAIKKLESYSHQYDKIVLYTDCMNSYKNINNLFVTKTGRKKHPKQKIHRLIGYKIKELMSDYDIDIRLIRGHCQVYGNELADRLAKKGNKGSNYYRKHRISNLDVFYNTLFNTKKVIYGFDIVSNQMRISYVEPFEV